MKNRLYKEELADYNGATDYRKYRMSFVEFVVYSAIGVLVMFAIGYIFYRSVIVAGLISILGLKYTSIRKKAIIEKRKKVLTLQFKDMLYSMSSAIGSGASVPNAIDYALKDMTMQYGEEGSFIVDELKLMKQKINIGMTIEDIFSNFALRSGCPDIHSFANIFEVSNRTGGDLIKIIRTTSRIISEKIDVKMEINTLISGKKTEQKVMTVVPFAMVALLANSSPEFMEPLYTTMAGRIISTIALVMIMIGYFISKKIADIKV